MGNLKWYLSLYNFILSIGWSYILWLTAHNQYGHTHHALSETTKLPLQVVQTAAILEIIHTALGIVKSSVSVTVIQVSSRMLMVWGILTVNPGCTASVGFPFVLIAWSGTEIVRYGHYFWSLVGYPKLMKWWRYSLFIVLVPLGLCSELMTLYSGILHVKINGPPPQLQFLGAFYLYALIFVGAVATPAATFIYVHMFSQRRKALLEHAMNKKL